jgi:hypothetical protein
MEAVSWVLLPKVVERSEPFHWTVAPEMNCEPVTVSVKPCPPARAELGLIAEIEGVGFLAASWIVKLKSLDAVLELLSVTWILNENAPAALGLPLRTPLAASSFRPEGRADEVAIVQV